MSGVPTVRRLRGVLPGSDGTEHAVTAGRHRWDYAVDDEVGDAWTA